MRVSIDAGGVGDAVQLGAEVGEQLLVGGDDRLALAERGDDQLAGRLDAADDLDHQIDVGIVDDEMGIADEHTLGEIDVSLARHAAHRDLGDLQAQPGAGLDRCRLRRDELHERGTHVPTPQHTDPDAIAVKSHARRLGRAPRAPKPLSLDIRAGSAIDEFRPAMKTLFAGERRSTDTMATSS